MNHIIGLPEKNDRTYPIFDYEIDVINKIENNRNIWIKKSAGIGATTLLLRYLVWKILVNNELEYKNIFIISGTHVRHANEVKVKMEDLFRNKFPFLQLDSKFTDLWIKNTNIKIFPSRNVKDLPGYTDKIILDYTEGRNKIYDPEEIEKKKLEPEFPREYMSQYLGRVGNVFTSTDIEKCIQLGEQYSTDKIPVSLYTLKSVGIDPGFSSSSTGIVILEHIKTEDRHIIRVVDCHLIDKGDPNKIVELCSQIYQKIIL